MIFLIVLIINLVHYKFYTTTIFWQPYNGMTLSLSALSSMSSEAVTVLKKGQNKRLFLVSGQQHVHQYMDLYDNHKVAYIAKERL